jgi:hypothetical protein
MSSVPCQKFLQTYILDTLGIIPIAPLVILSPHTSLCTSEKTTSRIVLLEVLIIVRKHTGHAATPLGTTTLSPPFPHITSSHEGVGSAALGTRDFVDLLVVDILLRVTIQASIDIIIPV